MLYTAHVLCARVSHAALTTEHDAERSGDNICLPCKSSIESSEETLKTRHCVSRGDSTMTVKQLCTAD